MPEGIGLPDEAGRVAFLDGMIDVPLGRRTMAEALADIEQAWLELEAADTG